MMAIELARWRWIPRAVMMDPSNWYLVLLFSSITTLMDSLIFRFDHFGAGKKKASARPPWWVDAGIATWWSWNSPCPHTFIGLTAWDPLPRRPIDVFQSLNPWNWACMDQRQLAEIAVLILIRAIYHRIRRWYSNLNRKDMALIWHGRTLRHPTSETSAMIFQVMAVSNVYISKWWWASSLKNSPSSAPGCLRCLPLFSNVAESKHTADTSFLFDHKPHRSWLHQSAFLKIHSLA